MNRLLLATILASLAGCAQFETFEQQALARAQTSTDAINARALWYLCEGTTVGGFQRLSPKDRANVVKLCKDRAYTWEDPGGR